MMRLDERIREITRTVRESHGHRKRGATAMRIRDTWESMGDRGKWVAGVVAVLLACFVIAAPALAGITGAFDIGAILLAGDDDEPTPYVVGYSPNLSEAQGEMSDSLFMTGTEYSLPDNAFTALHYTFREWNTAEDGSGTAYADGATVSDLSEEGEPVTLYAQWDARSYTMHFVGVTADVTGTMDDLTVHYDEEFTFPECTLSRPGYVLSGWSADQTGQSHITYPKGDPAINVIDTLLDDLGETDPDPFEVSETPEVTLYAQWFSETITVKFDKNASNAELKTGQSDITPVQIAYNGSLEMPESPYRRPLESGTGDYEFVGWSPMANSGEAVYEAGMTVTGIVLDDSTELTLYAQWRKPTYMLTYKPGTDAITGVTGMPSFAEDNDTRRVGWVENDPSTWKEEIGWNQEIAIPNGGLSKDHATLVGWKVHETDINPLGLGTTVSGLATDDSGTATLTAQWAPFTYTVRFDPNVPDGATRTDDLSAEESPENQVMTQSFPHEKANELLGNAYSTDYYTFVSWNTSPDGSGTAYDDGDLIQFIMSGETPAAGAKTIDDADMDDGDTFVLYAQWAPRDLVVSVIDSLANVEVSRQEIARGSSWQPVTAPAHTGYVAQSQLSVMNSSGTALDETALTNVTQDLIVTISYDPIKFTIAFDGNSSNTVGDVTGTMEPLTDVEYDSVTSIPDCTFANEPNSFLYWSTKPGPDDLGLTFINNADTSYVDPEVGGDPVKLSNLATQDGATVTLYAQWSKSMITVEYIDGITNTAIIDGEGNPVTEEVEYGSAATPPAFSSLQEANVHEGFYPAQWVPSEEGVDINRLTTGTRIVLQYAPVTYTVAFDSNASDATGTMESQTVEYNTLQSLPECGFTRPGNSFAGWNTMPDGSGIAYEDGDSMSRMTQTHEATVTLYAQWSAGSITVTFYDGHTNTKITDVTIIYGSDVTPPAFAAHEGYKPTGWDKSLENIRTDNLVITSIYVPITYKIAFDGNGDEEDPVSGTMADLAMTYNQSHQLTTCGFTREGFSFSHWSTNPDGTGVTYANKQAVSNLTSTDQATVTLYAQWKEALNVTYTIRHIKTTATEPFATEQQIGRVGNATKARPRSVVGYLPEPFDQKVIAEGDATGDATVVDIAYRPIVYTIAFDPNIVSASGKMAPIEVQYDSQATLPENKFSIHGYVWQSWNSSPTGAGYAIDDAQTVKNLTSIDGSTVTLYAQWAKLYTVVYVDSLDTDIPLKQEQLTDTSKAVPPTIPTHKGYMFSGWSKNTSLSGDVVYTAVYAETEANGRTTPENNEDEVNQSVVDRKTVIRRIVKDIVRTTVKWTKGVAGGSKMVNASGSTVQRGSTGAGQGSGGTGGASGTPRKGGSSNGNLTQTGDALVWICGASMGLAAAMGVAVFLQRKANEA